MALLEGCPGIDVCLSSHTHNRLYAPFVAGGALVIQSGSHGSFLGRLTLTIEESRVTGHTHELHEISEDIMPDAVLQARINAALGPFINLREVMGVTASALHEMLARNLEGTYSHDPLHQMGGYVKRALGLRAYFKAESPKGSRLQAVFVQGQPLAPDATYTAAFITSQDGPHQFGRNRQKTGQHAVAAMRAFLEQYRALVVHPHDTFTVA